jgi:TatD DNase family protein
MIDSHCHLAGEEFAADLPAVIDRARTAGLTGALVILSAADEAERQRARRVQELWPDVNFSVGIHPHQAGQYTDDLDDGISKLEAELSEMKAVALGEIGLDYHYDFSPRRVQQEVFRRQIRLARDRQLPIIIHTREATDDTFQLLREEADGVRTVFHCFTGGRDMARDALDIGAWVSFAGIVTFPKATELREVARMVPPDRLLVETDAPYLAPVPHRGKRNEPAFVARVVETVAELRGESVARTADLTVRNFASVFLNPRHSNGLAR